MAAVVCVAAAEALWAATRPAETMFLDTFYTDDHIHYGLRVAAILCLFAGFYALFPSITGWAYNRALAWLQFALTVVAVAGMIGTRIALDWLFVPRRYADYPDALGSASRIAELSALVAAAGPAAFLAVLAEALLRRRPAT